MLINFNQIIIKLLINFLANVKKFNQILIKSLEIQISNLILFYLGKIRRSPVLQTNSTPSFRHESVSFSQMSAFSGCIQNLLLVAEDASSKCFLILENLPVPSWVVLCRKSAALNSFLHWQDLYSSHLCFVLFLMSFCLKFLLCYSFLLVQNPRSNHFQWAIRIFC